MSKSPKQQDPGDEYNDGLDIHNGIGAGQEQIKQHDW